MTATTTPVVTVREDWHRTGDGCMSTSLDCQGYGVRIFQRAPGGWYYRMVLTGGRQKWKSLRTKNQEDALALGERFLAGLVQEMRAELDSTQGEAGVAPSTPTWPPTKGVGITSSPTPPRTTAAPSSAADVGVSTAPRPLTLYQLWRLYRRSSLFRSYECNTRDDSHYRVRMLFGGFGKHLPVMRANKSACEDYATKRRAGGIAYRIRLRSRTGRIVGRRNRTSKPVDQRSIEADLKLLHAMINWAMTEIVEEETGRTLLERDPMRGYVIEKELNPRQPTATQQRFEATLRSIDDELHELESDPKRAAFKRTQTRLRLVWSLRDALVVAEAAGRRVDCILAMDWADIHFGNQPDYSDGFLYFPSETDKRKRDAAVSVQPRVMATLHARRMRMGGEGARGPVFQSPTRSGPLNHDNLGRVLVQMERRAGLAKLSGSLFHAYRRKFATERSHLPPYVVMDLMGIKDAQVFKDSYCKSTSSAMREAACGARPNEDQRLEFARPRRAKEVRRKVQRPAA